MAAPRCSDCHCCIVSLKICNECLPKASSQPCQTSKIELPEKLVNSFQQFTTFTKNSILDVYQGYEYASGKYLPYF